MIQEGELDRAVGRLIIGRLSGLELSKDEIRCFRDGIMGGVTLFKDNASDVEQLVHLTDSICREVPGRALICVDQEGGAVQRLDQVLTPMPSAMAVAAMNDRQRASCLFELAAREMSLIGVNCLFSPVLDVFSNPLNPIIGTRSFGDSPSKVSELGSLLARESQAQGLLSVGKHFPGHGACDQDSHLQVAVSHADAETLWQRDLVPFKATLSQLPSIMVGHIWIPAIDHEVIPASLSPRVVTGLLREFLGFQGIIMTDDLTMKGVTERCGLGEAAVQAVVAGVDAVLICGDLAQLNQVHTALVKAVKDGRLALKTVLDSGCRINKALAALPAPRDRRGRITELSNLAGSGYERSLAVSISAISLLRGEIPDLFGGALSAVVPSHPRYDLSLGKYLNKKLGQSAGSPAAPIREIRYNLNPQSPEIESIVEGVRGTNCVFLTFRTPSQQGQIQLGRLLSEVCAESLSVAVDVPFDLIALPTWDNCLATFDPSDLAMEALSVVLTQTRKAEGICPVKLQIRL